MSRPQIQPPDGQAERTQWWQDWVDCVRTAPDSSETLGEERHRLAEYLFIGTETHNILDRLPRAVGRQGSGFADSIEYQEVTDLRSWTKSEPAPLLLHERILAEHCYIVGPSGSGKSSLGIIPLLIQLMRGSQSGEPSAPYPIVVLDLKGDAALFQTVRLEAKRRGQPFQFFSTERGAPTFRFNPFRGFDRASRSVAQVCQLILDALNLNHGKGYGRSYYTERSRNVLSRTLHRKPNIQSFDELHYELGETVRTADSRTKGDAFELLSVIEMLKEYRQLVTDPDETISCTDGIIFMPSVLQNRQVAYFWLPAALESISVGEIAKLVLFNLRVAAQDWKRSKPHDPRNVILVIDELQRVAGENLQGILQDSRSFGIHAILANQSLYDLKSPTGFDLAPTVMTNTRVKFFFTSPSERECFVYVERGKGLTKARQFPQRGNPWLRDLAPEEFAYHVQMAWPFSWEEFQLRESLPWPSWDDVPGGDFLAKRPRVEDPEEAPLSDALPRDFTLTRDEVWAQQVAAIRLLFENGSDQTPGPLFESPPSPKDLELLRDEILSTIADRGNDKSKRILTFFFENLLAGRQTSPTWREIWGKCWDEPLDSLKGADMQPANSVRQAVYRLREVVERFSASDASKRFSVLPVIEPNDYRLKLRPKTIDSTDFPDSPFPDSMFPGSE